LSTRALATRAVGALAALALLCSAPEAGARKNSAAAFKALASTPYMGWDTYFAFGPRFSESTVLEAASQLLARGLARDGYDYIWLDAGWWQGKRSPGGQIVIDPGQWPHGIGWLARTLHGVGLRLGVYTDAGTEGCGGPNAGSYGHYQQDMNTFAAWGVDAVKVDFCGGVRLKLQPKAAYTAIHRAILSNSSHRPMLLSVCNFLEPGQYSSNDPGFAGSGFSSYLFGPSVANSWRTDTDVGIPGDVTFATVLRNMDADATHPEAAGPGHWNDPDYLGPDQDLSAAQFRTQFSMWAMLAAPLMISDNLATMSPESQATVENREVIALDQDRAGVQGTLVASSGDGQVWVKPLGDGSRAVALLNRGSNSITITTSALAVGMPPATSYTLHDLWTGSTEATNSPIGAQVAGESTVLFRVWAAGSHK
jgi:alpha-galactosidase